MVIDFHTHCFPEKIALGTINTLAKSSGNTPFTDGTADGLLSNISKAGADIAINLPVLTKPTQFDTVARYAIFLNEKFSLCSRKIISFAGIHPACEDINGKMRFLKENGIKGVKIHPDYQETFIDDDGYVGILQCAKELDMIVVTHAGVDDGYVGKPVRCPPRLVKKVIDKVGHSKFVLGHYGGHKQWQEVLDQLCGLDVYFDTAYTLHEIDESLFKKILEKHGEDKILFATDCPWRDIATDLSIIRNFNLCKETEEKILYKNALKLLNN